MLLTILNMSIPSSYATDWLSIPDTRLTWDTSIDAAPSIAQAQDGRIWIVWHSFEVLDGTNPDIFYKLYDGSSTFPWSPTKRLTTHPSTDMTPSITATTDGDIWVVWSSNRDGNFEIYYKIYKGSSWSPDTRLTTDPNKDESPSVAQDKDGDIWVVWSSNRAGNFEIHYRLYDSQTKEWQPEGQLTWDPSPDLDPSITQVQDDTMWIVWERSEDLYYTAIFKNMTVKINDTPLTTDSYIDWYPSIMQTQDGAIWIAWAAERPPIDNYTHMDIYCKIINSTLPPEERITYNDADDLMPTIMQAADGKIWIAWASTRLGNFDIYYKTDSLPHLHDMAIVSVTYEPNVTYVRRGLNISIEVVPQNQGVEPEYFNVSCYANSNLIGSEELHLSPGQLTPINFIWKTSGIASGIYTITSEVSIVQGETDTTDNTFINGVIQVIIPGDADLNGLVELPDFYIWVKNFGNTPGQCPPGVYPDFDNNGLVELDDFYIWVNNFGAK